MGLPKSLWYKKNGFDWFQHVFVSSSHNYLVIVVTFWLARRRVDVSINSRPKILTKRAVPYSKSTDYRRHPLSEQFSFYIESFIEMFHKMMGLQVLFILVLVAWKASSFTLRINKSIPRVTTKISVHQNSAFLPGSDFTAEQMIVLQCLSIPLAAYLLLYKPMERTSAVLDKVAELLRIGESQKLLTGSDDQKKDPR